MGETVGLLELYEWTLRVQDELEELSGAFPEALKQDRSRVVMSISMLRVSLEVRVKRPYSRGPGAKASGAGPHPADGRLTDLDRRGPDGAGSAPTARL